MSRAALAREGRAFARLNCNRVALRLATGLSVDLFGGTIEDAAEIWHDVTAWAGPAGGAWS